jgi:hypothetical protein
VSQRETALGFVQTALEGCWLATIGRGAPRSSPCSIWWLWLARVGAVPGSRASTRGRFRPLTENHPRCRFHKKAQVQSRRAGLRSRTFNTMC